MEKLIDGLSIKYTEKNKIEINFKLIDTKLIGEYINLKLGIYLQGKKGFLDDIDGPVVFKKHLLEVNNRIVINFNKCDLFNYKGINFNIVNKISIIKVGDLMDKILYNDTFQIGNIEDIRYFKNEYFEEDKKNLKYIYKMLSYNEKLVFKILFFCLIGSLLINFFFKDYVFKDFYHFSSFYLEGCFPIIITFVVYIFFFSNSFNYVFINIKNTNFKKSIPNIFNFGILNNIFNRIKSNFSILDNSLDLGKLSYLIKNLSIISKVDLERYDIKFYLITKENYVKGSGKHLKYSDEIVSSQLIYTKHISYSYMGEDLTDKVLRDFNSDVSDKIKKMPKSFSFKEKQLYNCGLINYLLVVIKHDKLIDIKKYFRIK